MSSWACFPDSVVDVTLKPSRRDWQSIRLENRTSMSIVVGSSALVFERIRASCPGRNFVITGDGFTH